MKINHQILIAVLILLNILGCKDSFIELTPPNFLSSATFYNTKKDFDQALMGVYGGLQDFYNGEGYWLGDLPSDVAVKEFNNNDRGGEQYEMHDEFRVTSDNTLVNSVWNSCFSYINQANIVLDKLTTQNFLTESEVAQYEGELKFVRAILYFQLVRLYGDVPLILEPVKSASGALSLSRDPKTDVYQAIIDDLTQAIEKLPVGTTNLGRASKGAAQGLLGKVYLFLGQRVDALQQFRAVMTSGKYDLLGNYANVFDPSFKDNVEAIFEIQYITGGLNEGSTFCYKLVPQTSNSVLTYNTGVYVYQAYMVPTKEFMGEIEPGDLRKDVLYKEYWVNASGDTIKMAWTTKYYFPGPANGQDSPANWHFLRYADILLCVAEILNEDGYAADGEAFDLLNRIRTRAGLPAKTSAELTNQEEFRTAIAQERKVELAFEGHRWWDLIRTGKAITRITEHGQIEMADPTTYRNPQWPRAVGSYIITENELIWPIPVNEIQKVPGVLQQNPGY